MQKAHPTIRAPPWISFAKLNIVGWLLPKTRVPSKPLIVAYAISNGFVPLASLDNCVSFQWSHEEIVQIFVLPMRQLFWALAFVLQLRNAMPLVGALPVLTTVGFSQPVKPFKALPRSHLAALALRVSERWRSLVVPNLQTPDRVPSQIFEMVADVAIARRSYAASASSGYRVWAAHRIGGHIRGKTARGFRSLR